MRGFIFFLLFLLPGCVGLEPEARWATFILFDNAGDVTSYFIVDGDKHTAYAHEQALYPVTPGRHVVEMAGGASGPETLYIAPCQVETLRFAYSTD
jgi:hypothetical protein